MPQVGHLINPWTFMFNHISFLPPQWPSNIASCSTAVKLRAHVTVTNWIILNQSTICPSTDQPITFQESFRSDNKQWRQPQKVAFVTLGNSVKWNVRKIFPWSKYPRSECETFPLLDKQWTRSLHSSHPMLHMIDDQEFWGVVVMQAFSERSLELCMA